MTDVTYNSRIQNTIIRLLEHYSFDSDDRPMSFVVADWVGCYPWQWILDAIIEALYQGRYKTISVEQILIIWQRRGHPLHHFNGEFERIVCGQLLNAPSVLKEGSIAEQRTLEPVETSNQPGLAELSLSPATHRHQHSSTDMLSSHNQEELDCLDGACMGSDGRLSEILGDPINVSEIDVAAPNVPACLANSRALRTGSMPSIELKHYDSAGYKVPVPIFEPRNDLNPGEAGVQQLTGKIIRHYPIHQFTPTKPSPSTYNKLKAIAHDHP